MRRLFVDPGITSSGWALFEEKELLDHGTVKPPGPKKATQAERLRFLLEAYREIGEWEYPSEVYIEKCRRSILPPLFHKSVGIIEAALQDEDTEVLENIPNVSWQRYAGYEKGKKPQGRLKKHQRRVKSEDELAAIGMGLWHLGGRKKR